jgi:hypothetical protein
MSFLRHRNNPFPAFRRRGFSHLTWIKFRGGGHQEKMIAAALREKQTRQQCDCPPVMSYRSQLFVGKGFHGDELERVVNIIT